MLFPPLSPRFFPLYSAVRVAFYRLATLSALVVKVKLELHQGHTVHLLFSKYRDISYYVIEMDGTLAPKCQRLFFSLAPNLCSFLLSPEPADRVS